MKKKNLQASYTIEAAIYIPLILFMQFQTVDLAIDFWKESRQKVYSLEVKELDLVKEFYVYQGIDEIRKEIENDKP